MSAAGWFASSSGRHPRGVGLTVRIANRTYTMRFSTGYPQFLGGRLLRPAPCVWLLLCGLLGAWGSALAVESGRSHIDTALTASPRQTLYGFIRIMNARFESSIGQHGLVNRYLRSGQLFPDRQELKRARLRSSMERTTSSKYLDLSGLPSVIVDQAGWRIAIQLKEVLDRIPLPDEASVPDGTALGSDSAKVWTLPGTDLRIAQMESGPQRGQYLFSKETIAEIPELFEAIKSEPYLATGSPGMYEGYFGRPIGLAVFFSRIIPPRWILTLPDSVAKWYLGEPLWRWLALIATVLLVGLIGRLAVYARRRVLEKGEEWSPYGNLIPPLLILLMVPVLEVFIGEYLRVSPLLYMRAVQLLWIGFYLAGVLAIWFILEILAEWIIRADFIATDSTDSQLIRLGGRLIALILAAFFLVEGANRVGIPAYSIATGFGIGGLAVALAGQHALGNLLGSLIIMIEKPFAIGHEVLSNGIEGVVEDVGFRTTHIRLKDGSLQIIPSSDIVRGILRNDTLRTYRRFDSRFNISVAVHPDALERYLAELNELAKRPHEVRQASISIRLIDITTSGFAIRVKFKTEPCTDEAYEMLINQFILDAAKTASRLGVPFTLVG